MRELRETPDMRGRLPRERFYGRRKMTHLLRRAGWKVSEGQIGRLMRQAGMKGLVKGIRKITTRKTREPQSNRLAEQGFYCVSAEQSVGDRHDLRSHTRRLGVCHIHS
jgi:transposase InsO family protein